MTESELYQKEIKKILKHTGCFFQRIESARIPDIYCSKGGNTLWIELKCTSGPRDIIVPDWRPGQLAWIKEHKRYGSTNICLVLNHMGSTFWLEPKNQYYKEELICLKNHYLNLLKK